MTLRLDVYTMNIFMKYQYLMQYYNIQNMIREQQKCFQRRDAYTFQCAAKVLENYSRQLPFVRNLIYQVRSSLVGIPNM